MKNHSLKSEKNNRNKKYAQIDSSEKRNQCVKTVYNMCVCYIVSIFFFRRNH